MLPALALAIAYVAWQPASADLAAQTFRADLFAEHGFLVYTTDWYGGVHLPGYSVLFPPLGALVGVRVAGALAVVAAAALFAALVRPRYGERARLAIWLFGLGAATNLFTGRLTFALGLAVGTGALLAAARGRRGIGGALAALTAAASPVAALFVALAGAAALLAGKRGAGLALALPALAATALLAALFPTAGYHPLAAGTLALALAGAVLVWAVLPRDERALRWGAALFAALCVAAFALETPVGGNATRLGALAAAPVVALAWGRRPAALLALALLPLMYWQWAAPVRDVIDAEGDPSADSGFHAPLLAELAGRTPARPFRVHVPPTRNRWEAVHVAERHPLARGWLRQAEAEDFELFTDGELTPAAYRGWLAERGVAFVAVPQGVELDYLAEDEAELIERGLPILRAIWSSGDWELYAVRDRVPIAPVPAEIGPAGFELRAPAAEPIPVQVRFSPYFRVLEGEACVAERDGWSVVEAKAPGTIRVEAGLSVGGLGRALTGGERACAG